ncbi:MAG TPA: FUSC family membrane protein [Flavisolibacter sp.]|nr:FUSC family membrane protein [Flavisolibacter sp.]
MQTGAKEIRYFFYSQSFADGFRAAFAILLPALAGSYLGFFDAGLTISLGAMCASLTDAPGPVLQRRNGMLFCMAFAFLVSIATSFAQANVVTMGIEIAVVSFFFSMFNVYGSRATSVGNAAILVMILTMDKPVEGQEILPHAFLIFGGGLYYLGLSLLLHTIRPYRIAQRALGDCIREIAVYLSIKADFYDVNSDLAANYRRLVAQQVVVNEKQDAVRELFFKTRRIVEESTPDGRRLVLTFVETVDLFEDITASYYDYDLLRKQFQHTGALELIEASLKKTVRELDAIGVAIQANAAFHAGFDYDAELRDLKSNIDLITKNDSANSIVLKKILVNLRRMLNELKAIREYFGGEMTSGRERLDHAHFVSHQSLDPRIFWNNLSLQSSVFRHSLRVTIACVAGFIIARVLAYGHHSYWVLMTIAFMLKPAFSLTKQRNIERIVGTLAGGVIGVLILVFIPNKSVQFAFMVVFMIATYSFMRIQYLLMVICTTPYILILFSFLGTAYRSVAQERIFDTVLGCAIAFSASYFLFPSWESGQLKTYMNGIVKANANYLEKILKALCGNQVTMLEYKLARKDVYLNSANLSAAFQRMLSEPKSKQRNSEQVHQFVVLSLILYSNIATVATSLIGKEPRNHDPKLIRSVKRSLSLLAQIVEKIDGKPVVIQKEEDKKDSGDMVALGSDELLLRDQLAFIQRLIADMGRSVTMITSG